MEKFWQDKLQYSAVAEVYFEFIAVDGEIITFGLLLPRDSVNKPPKLETVLTVSLNNTSKNFRLCSPLLCSLLLLPAAMLGLFPLNSSQAF